MKRDEPETDSKTALERFTKLGEGLMRVPREHVAALEKKWRKQRKRVKRT